MINLDIIHTYSFDSDSSSFSVVFQTILLSSFIAISIDYFVKFFIDHSFNKTITVNTNLIINFLVGSINIDF